jgi:hypothetical protein
MSTRKNHYIALALVLGLIAFVMASFASRAEAGEPGNQDSPIVVSSPDDVPAGATVVSETKNDDCSTTTVWVVTEDGSEPVTHQEWGTEDRTRTSEEVPDYKTKYQYQKQVRGVIQQRDNGRGQWHNTGQTFDWEWWVGNTTQWSFDDVEVLQSGPHNATQATWTQGHHEWRKQTTAYQYVKNGVTEQVQVGSHTEYGKWSEWATLETGLLEEPVLPENTLTHEYRATGPVTVVDQDGVDPSAVYYSYNDGVTCDVPEEPPTTTPPTHQPPPTVPPTTRTRLFCISPDTVKVVHLEFHGGEWVDVGAEFRSAPKRCNTPDAPVLKETGF